MPGKAKGDILLFPAKWSLLWQNRGMPRTARASVGGICYHVINRENGRQEVFRKSGDYKAFVNLFDQACSRVSMRMLGMFPRQNPKNPVVPEPLETHGIKIVFPMLLADRLVAQTGGFTIQDPWLPLTERDHEDFEEKSLDIVEILKWKLPAAAKLSILDELHRVSVNRRTLFPGLDSLGSGLRVAEGIR